uniref:ditrans,polycis-polyprenyl diphosphate synthase [(2E,6E)-farnesyldiphosphate specific] n=1 Tax=Leptobrachium leishanense TaxID=445787 RepID=A0A8C5WHG3_9ANUR
MSVVFELAWRFLHVVLGAQRALFLLWVRFWSWGLWRAAAALLLPTQVDLVRPRCEGQARPCQCEEKLRLQCECRYLQQCEQATPCRTPARELSSLAKLPAHLALLINEDARSYTDVASLVVWGMAAGITCITVYDQQGIFKENISRLMDEVLKQQKKLLDHEYSKCPAGYANGSIEQTNNKELDLLPVLKVLSAEDGKAEISKAAKNFCQLVAEQKKKPSDMDVNVLDRLLRSAHSFPDPDLILKFGNVASTLGFLPWHIRLSEIISLPSHVNICYEDFYSALHCYAGCEQRIGK